MKNYKAKTKVSLITLATALIALVLQCLDTPLTKEKNMKLRVAFPYDKSLDFYEPTRIHLAPEYVFLENVFSPLIELSKKDGTPTSGVAESFKWKNGSLHLKIRKNLKTVDGHQITADDVLFSLKRVIVLTGNTHGNFKDLICPNETLESVESHCAGITIGDNSTVILSPNEEKPFLIPMLAAIDFAIIPKSSVDPVSLKIRDFRNTSGPYYVEADDGVGNITLKANKSHYNYTSNMPQEVQLVPAGVPGTSTSIELFEDNKVDYITTIDKLNPEKVIDFATAKGHELHTTLNIRTFLLTFTEKGLNKFSPKERLFIGKKVREAFQVFYKDKSGYSPSSQFFPALSDGSLNGSEGAFLNTLYDSQEELAINNLEISIIRLGDISQFQTILQEKFDDVIVEEGTSPPAFIKHKDPSEMPDCFIGGPDTGFLEDIGLISYSTNAGIFGMDESERKEWLASYMNMLNREERLKRLKQLHTASLKNGITVPLVSAPYVAVARKPWKIGLSQIYGNNPLWPIAQN